MLQLKNKDKRKIAGLKDYKDLCIESILESGDKTLSFLIPKNSIHFNLIEEEGYIQTKENEYVIKEIHPKVMAEVKAVLNLEELEGEYIDRFESIEQPISACLNLALVNTGWRVGKCDVTKKRTVRSTNQSAYQVIQDIKKRYRVDLVFNTLTKRIDVYEELGEDRGVYLMEDLNLRSLDVQSNTYKFYTRVKAEGKDGLTFASINGGKDYIENHQYSNKVKTYYWKDDRYTVKESLKEDATTMLEELSKPYRSYGAEIINLAKHSDKYKDILDYGLGDKIILKSKSKKINEKQRITKLIEYPQNYMKDSIEIANTRLSFEDIQQEFDEVADTVDNITNDNGTIDGDTIDEIKTEQIKNFKTQVMEAGEIHAIKGDFQSLNATVGRFGEVLATKISATELEAVEGKFQVALINKADIVDLNATNGKIDILESKTAQIDIITGNVADIKDIINGNLSSENIQTGAITGDRLNMKTVFIEDGNILNVNASKINSGEVNTNQVKIKSENGGIEIVGATQQFKDKNNRVRIQMGQDTAGNFNFILRDEDGTSTLIDHTGIKENAISNNLIKENMINENAVGEKAIDYNSFTTGFNKDTNTTEIKATKVRLDNENQTLDVAFNTVKSKTEGNTTTLGTHTTEISVAKGKIETLIADTTITKDGQTVKLKDQYNKTEQTVNFMKNTIAEHETTLDEATGDLKEVTIKANNLERSLNSTSSTLTETNKKVETQSQQITNVTTTANKTKDKLDNLQVNTRNIVIDGNNNNQGWTTTNYNITNRKVPTLKPSTTYTVVLKAKVSENKQVGLWWNGGHNSAKLFSRTKEIDTYTAVIRTPSELTSKTINVYNYPSSINAEMTLYWICLYEGNITAPIEWTPALEDIDQAIEDVTTTVTNIETTVTNTTSKVNEIKQEIGRINLGVEEINKTTTEHNVTIQQHTEQIASKPNQSNINTAKNEAINTANATTETKLTVVRDNIRTNSASIETMKDQINLKVSQTDIDKTVFDMQIGNENLIDNSGYLENLDHWAVNQGNGATSSGVYLDSGMNSTYKGVSLTNNTKPSGSWCVLTNTSLYDKGFKFTKDKPYTLSGIMWVNSPCDITIQIADGNSENAVLSVNKTITMSGHYNEFSVTFTPKTTGNHNHIRFSINREGTSIFVPYVKLEQGNKNSAWCFSKKDMEKFTITKISEATAQIKLTTDSINLEVSKKVNSNAIVSSINQTAEAVKIKAGKIELNGATSIGDSDSNHVKIENANYTIQAGGSTKLRIGVGQYGTVKNVPSLTMGVYGLGVKHHEFGIVCYGGGAQNPSNDDKAYVDMGFYSKSNSDWSNIKMFDGGIIRIAPVKELEITTNYTKGAYHGTWERQLAKFATKSSGSYEKYLEIQALVNTENYNGLVLADERSGKIETRVRVETGSDGNRYFCDAYNSGTVRLGASGYPWHSVTTKKGVSYSVVDNDGFRSVNIDRSIESVLDSIKFDMDIHRRTNGDTIDNKLHLDIGRLKRHPMADIFLNRVTENISGNEAKEYVTADMTSLLHLALYEIQKLKSEMKILKGSEI